jgi:hypothetical protein
MELLYMNLAIKFVGQIYIVALETVYILMRNYVQVMDQYSYFKIQLMLFWNY